LTIKRNNQLIFANLCNNQLLPIVTIDNEAIELSVFQLGQYVVQYVVIERSDLGTVFPFRSLFACLLLFFGAWSVISPLLAAIAKAKQMHRIPCTKCRFFTNDYRLKCTIKPQIANTEEAIDCCDYQKNC
jgi:hypothetical protein